MQFENKEEIVKKVQKSLGLKDDGIDGPNTWKQILIKITGEQPSEIPIINSDNESNPLSAKAFALILKHEVGGGENYYNKYLKHPCYPGGESGVTIGIGYDLGYNTSYEFSKDWKGIIDTQFYIRLLQHLGKKSSKAKAAISSIDDIQISWDAAQIIFKKNTLPRFINETKRAFPNSEKLHPDAFGALVSLVFNRGASISGPSRIEMLNIRNLIDSKNYKAIANEVRKMKRLWVNKGLDGLLARRDEEAALIESCD